MNYLTSERKSRVKTVISKEQLRLLEKVFEENTKPHRMALGKVAIQTGLSQRAVQVWFQNRRSREKRCSMRVRGKTDKVKECKIPTNETTLENADAALSQEETDGDTSSRVRMKRRSPVYPGERSWPARAPQPPNFIMNPYNQINCPNVAHSDGASYQPGNHLWPMVGAPIRQLATNLFENDVAQVDRTLAGNQIPAQWQWYNPIIYPPPPAAFNMNHVEAPQVDYMNANMYSFNNLDHTHHY